MNDNPVFCEVDKFLLNVAGTGVAAPSSPLTTPPKRAKKLAQEVTNVAQMKKISRAEPNGLVEGEHCLLIEMPLILYQMPDLTPDDKVHLHGFKVAITIISKATITPGPPLLPRLMHLEIKSCTIPTVQPCKK